MMYSWKSMPPSAWRQILHKTVLSQISQISTTVCSLYKPLILSFAFQFPMFTLIDFTQI